MSDQPEALPMPPHPFWCDDCGAKAGFCIQGCPIDHAEDCRRAGEDLMAVYDAAAEWCRATGGLIP